MENKPQTSQVIYGVGDNDKLVVLKSSVLVTGCSNILAVEEKHILDLFLARINIKNPEASTLIITKDELLGSLGLKEIKKEVLLNRLESLATKEIKLPPRKVFLEDKNLKGKYTFIPRPSVPLFESATLNTSANAFESIELKANSAIYDIFFEIEKTGYVKYKLKDSLFRSDISYELCLYLLSNSFRGKWLADIDELKKRLGCTSELYAQNKHFKANVLNRAKKDIESKTTLQFSFRFVKTRRDAPATNIEFQILSNGLFDMVPELVIDCEDVAISDPQSESMSVSITKDPQLTDSTNDEPKGKDAIKSLIAAQFPELDEKEVSLIASDAKKNDRDEIYVREQLALISERRGKIDDLVAFLRWNMANPLQKGVKKESKKKVTQPKSNPNKFHNFEQRKYPPRFYELETMISIYKRSGMDYTELQREQEEILKEMGNH